MTSAEIRLRQYNKKQNECKSGQNLNLEEAVLENWKKEKFYSDSIFSPFSATAPIWALAYFRETLFHFSLLDFRHLVVLHGRVIISSQGLYVYTNRAKRTYT
jgi:hypothetical protein